MERWIMLTEKPPTDDEIEAARLAEIEIVFRGLPQNPFLFTHLQIGEGFSGAIVDHPALVANLLPHMDIGIFDRYPHRPTVLETWRCWRARVDLLANQAF